MPKSDSTQLPPLTHKRWLEILETYGSPMVEPQIRRETLRFHVQAGARLTFVLPESADKTPAGMRCQVLQASTEGLMLRSHRELPRALPVTVELGFEDEAFTLAGRTAHCTGTVGAFKLGVQLNFEDDSGRELEFPEDEA